MNAKNLIQSVLLLSFAVAGPACSATTSSPARAAYDARDERVADVGHALGRPSAAIELHRVVVRR